MNLSKNNINIINNKIEILNNINKDSSSNTIEIKSIDTISENKYYEHNCAFILKKGWENATVNTIEIKCILSPNAIYTFHTDNIYTKKGRTPNNLLKYTSQYIPEPVSITNYQPFIGLSISIQYQYLFGENYHYLIFNNETYTIPSLSAKDIYLKDYRCMGLTIGKNFHLDNREYLTYSEIEYSTTYLEDFVMKYGKGNGLHFRSGSAGRIITRTNDNSSGFILLARSISKNRICICAFIIQNNTGIYIKPGILFCDDYLVGRYNIGITNDIIYNKFQAKTKRGQYVKFNISQKN
jgi:hypothetical protein